MKNFLIPLFILFILFIFFIFSCDSKTKNETKENTLGFKEISQDTNKIISTPNLSFPIPIDTPSTIDSTLRNGYFLENKGMERDGYYVNGKKQGIFRTYYDKKKGRVMSIILYQADTVVWSACPEANKNKLMHIKGIKTHSDSTFVVAPHLNGQTWYKGLFNFRKPIGIHKTYFQNGVLMGVVNYTNKEVVEYDSASKVIFIGTISSYWEYYNNKKK